MTARTKSMTPRDKRAEPFEATISAGVPRGLLDFAVARGARRQALLRRAGLDVAELDEPDDRIPLRKYAILMRAAKELSGDPALALRFGEAVELGQISILGHLDHGIETMDDVFAHLNRYASLMVDTGGPSPRLLVERRRGAVWIIDRRPAPNDFPELTESSFARMVCGARRVFGEGGLLKAVHVTHAAPAYRDEYERVFRAPVVFESEVNALVYDATWWQQKIPRQSPYVSGILAAHADGLLRELEASRSIRSRVERLLASRLAGGDTSMDAVASELGVTRQTLLRRLRAAGATFAQLLDEARRTAAIEALRDRGLSVKEAAFRVGYSDPAPFSRAFKRWTGEPPRDFAARHARARRRPRG
jgi:AraC-like DNA-binding protein